MARVTADAIVAAARAEIGYTESPPGSNRTKFGQSYGLDGYPWCMIFVQQIFALTGAADMLPAKTGSCSAFMAAAKKAGRWVTGGYKPGDVVIYGFRQSGGKLAYHTGIVWQVISGGVMAIEGNTSASDDSNGGEVMARIRRNSVILGAFRPDYISKEVDQKMVYKYLNDVPEKFRPTIEKLMDAGIIQGDGSDQSGNGDMINLTHEQVRTLVFMVRTLERFGLHL